jgi:hypothetical protein
MQEAMQMKEDEAARRAQLINHLAKQQQEVHDAEAEEDQKLMKQYTTTLYESMMRTVMPSLCCALAEVVKERPKDPVGFVARHLLKLADEQDSQHADPYSAPVYAERRELLVAKAAREAAREEERHAKAAREAAQRIKADEELRAMLIASVQKHQSMLRS